MKLLFTGASGFLGNNILPLLRRDFDSVTTLGHLPSDDLTVDLSRETPELPEAYDIVLHAAGEAHMVPRTECDEHIFYAVNHEGTRRLCDALEKAGTPKSLIFISTVAVYGCECGELIDESHPLEGRSAYARSKIMAEEYLTGWCRRNGVVLTILRPSLIAGTNPPGNLGAMVRGIRRGMYVNIAQGKASKSILMAEDIANLIPLVADKGGIYNVCDSEQPTFGQLSLAIASQLGKRKPLSIPMWMARMLARVGDLTGGRFPVDSRRLEKITRSLTFSNRKAVDTLGWQPLKVLDRLRVD